MSQSLKRLLNPVEDGEAENASWGFGDTSPLGEVLAESFGETPRRSEFLGPGSQLGDILVFGDSFADNFSQIRLDPMLDPQVVPMNWGMDGEMLTDLTPLPSSQGSLPSSMASPLPFAGDSIDSSARAIAESTAPAGEYASIVCFGTLRDIEVKLVGEMNAIDERLRTGGYQCFSITQPQDHVMLCFPGDKKEFGYLRSQVGKTLSGLLHHDSVLLEPEALKGDLRDIIARASKPDDARVKVHINVYGPQHQASDVGAILSRGKLWLQQPNHDRRDCLYNNPHVLEIEFRGGEAEPPPTIELTIESGTSRKKTREEQLRKMVEEVYQSIDKNRQLTRVDGGRRVIRQLLSHQEEALGFMLERESGHITDRYRLWQEVELDDGRFEYRHKITKARRLSKPDERGGGILADEMGMGKSLSILALIMKTLEHGREWAKQKNDEHRSKRLAKYTGSTLILVSSALLIDNWANEIDTHLEGGLHVMKYHGNGREKEIRSLESSDIVVTTYHTLTAEHLVDKGRSSALHQIGWYRVVLDEAHIIRRPSTTFFHACNGLFANSRWCLTGTPIQNKLSDIGTLFSFIRAEPFVKPSVFRKWIEIPFEYSDEDSSQVKERLVTLLTSLCLRRTRELLDLPGTVPETRFLELTTQEYDQYRNTKRILERTMKQRVGDAEKSSKFSLFQVKLQLRILCNHGTFQKQFSWRRSRLDEREAFMASWGAQGEMLCCVCNQSMPILGSNWAENEFEGHCDHVLCAECIDESRGSELGSGRRRCPVCEKWHSERHLRIAEPEQPQDPTNVGARVKKSSVKDDHKNYFNHEGYSTKINALIEDVGKDLWEMKSIIFSCWTRTLYLVSRHLDKANIPYLQVDGDCPFSQRQKRLEEFAKSPDMPVLIMTTGTGAFGLNLTCANRIFIVELQWNPSVENQAIARAIRLGQKSEVHVIRYVIKDTVEDGMRQQQRYKNRIAGLGFEEGPGSLE